MSRLTPLLLLALVGALGFLVYRQAEREADDPVETVGPLFPGVDPARISAVRLENLERAIHVQLSRDRAGVWFITDPIAYAAEPAVVEQVFEIVRGNLAAAVPDALAEPAAAGLAPPRAFLEVIETLDDGTARRTRVELGDVDLDGQRCYVRRDGEVLRTRRNLESLLERDVPDLRSRRLFRVDPRAVVELRREGRVYVDGAAPSVDLLVQAEGVGWRMHRPVRALADADLCGALTMTLATTRIERFVTDLPEMDLAPYALDPPWFSVTLVDRRGAESKVEFGRTEGGAIHARYPGQPHVFEITPRSWNAVVAESGYGELLERELIRTRRDGLAYVELVRPAGLVRLTRAADGAWSVAERPAGEDVFRLEQPAEEAAVDDVLSVLERTKVATYLLDRTVEEALPAAGRDSAIWYQPVGDRRYGGWLGPPTTTPEGTPVRCWVREGETVVGAVDPALGDLLELEAGDFLRRIVWDVTEAQLARLELRGPDGNRAWVRGDGFTWRPEDAEVPARDLRQHLDAIFFLKAAREIPEGERAALTKPVEIVLTPVGGEPQRATLGVVSGAAEGERVQLRIGPRQAAAKDQGLHAALLALLAN